MAAPATAPDGHDLPARWSGRDGFVIFDCAFGDGAAFLATVQAWRDDPSRPRRLHYIGLAAVLPEPAPLFLREAAPCLADGLQRIFFDQGRVVLDLAIGAAAADAAQIDARVDAFYAGAAWMPATVPAARLGRLAAAGATLAGAGIDGDGLRQLAAAGFHAAPTQPGQLVFSSRRPAVARGPAPVNTRQAIVIGAGLAGAAACERLAARGWAVTLIERHAAPAQAASGNLAGIFMPQLSSDDSPAARLSRAAFLFALRQWERLGGVGQAFPGAACGVLQLARDAGHAQVQRAIAAAATMPPQLARWLDAEAASGVLGAPAPDGGWLFELGGWAHPAGVCAVMLEACGSRLTRRFSRDALRLRRDEGSGDWTVFDATGLAIASAPVVILANGTDACAFEQAAGLPLRAVRGQVTHLAEGILPAPPLVVCREAYMTPPSRGIVSVGATYDTDADVVADGGLRPASQRQNLARLAAILSVAPPEAPLAGRTGWRCVAPDRLPLVGALPDAAAAALMMGTETGRAVERLRDVPRHAGLYGLLGYASRGLIWAPLAAELLVARLEGEPQPLEADLAASLDPARFLLKQLRRGHKGRAPAP
jgi:tRNA 5-methylaminomethyl-2-thiouridine biosynthesis bifunctional protein